MQVPGPTPISSGSMGWGQELFFTWMQFSEKGRRSYLSSQRLAFTRPHGAGERPHHIFWCHFNRMFLENHQKSTEARDAWSIDKHLLQVAHLAHLDGTNPFPKTNLSGVNIDAVEVGRHQSPQHEEEADEAGTREPERDVTTGDTEGLPGPRSQDITDANTHPWRPGPEGGAAPQLAWLWGPKAKAGLNPSILSPESVPFQPSPPRWAHLCHHPWKMVQTVCRISHIYYKWGPL